MATSVRKFTTNGRMLNEVLTKYKNTFSAFCELINNSIQANSKNIYISIGRPANDEMHYAPIKYLEIKDDGVGVPVSEFDTKICEVANQSKSGGQGVGRFGALQIGERMAIETVGFDSKLQRHTKVLMVLNTSDLADNQLDKIPIVSEEEVLTQAEATYYKVRIDDVHHGRHGKTERKRMLSSDFFQPAIRYALFERYPSLIFNNNVNFYVNDEKLNREEFVKGTPFIKKTQYQDAKGEVFPVQVTFYEVNSDINRIQIYLQHDNAGIQSVSHEFVYNSNSYTIDMGTWFIYVESPFLNRVDLFRNIEYNDLLDKQFTNFKNKVKEVVDDFFRERNKRFEQFKKDFKKDTENPLKDNPALNELHETVLNQIAFAAETEFKLLESNNKIRGLLYELMDRAIRSGQIQDIFEKILKLDNQTVDRFHSLLQKTDLETVIQFSNNVATKNQFLKFLHNIVFGAVGNVLRERSQLHKIVEQHLWLFGENYAETPVLWSDKQIGGILNEIRDKHLAYEPSEEAGNIIDGIDEHSGLNDITDLFFYNEKILDNGKHEYMVVELKAPKCKLSQKELNQIDKYAFTIEDYSALPSENVVYKLILVSTDVTKFAKSKLASARAAHPNQPFLYDLKVNSGKHIEVYVMTWSEIIETNKRRLNYLANGLKTLDEDVKEKFEREYPQILNERVSSTLRKTKTSF
ncbi:ATP-binding protein [Rudanella lutea]|uniref:ATP-binding protein n=1 Tax=Rudanella lutea TaxID=451374 RepID=UPI00037599A1|nr:ATP-binding protein [Rudanella lutea]